MKQLDQKWFSETGPISIWSHGSASLIPERTRRLITVIMPAFYVLMMFFGISAAFITLPVFDLLVGTFYGAIWGICVALASLVSVLSLIFRLRLEIYSSIVLGALLSVYVLYLIYYVLHDPTSLDTSRIGLVFAAISNTLLPGWRVIDIVLEVRKRRQRQLYAEDQLGGSNEDDVSSNHISS